MIFKRIKNLRIDQDKKQREVADFLHLTRSAYSNYENGLRDMPIPILCGLADFYHTSVDYLLERTDEAKPYPRKSNLK